MHAALVDHANLAAGDAERDKLFAKNSKGMWRAARLGYVSCEANRRPIPPQRVSHRCSRADATQVLIIVFAQHCFSAYTKVSKLGKPTDLMVDVGADPPVPMILQFPD